MSSAEFAAGEAVPTPKEPLVVMLPDVFTLVTEVFPNRMLLFEAEAPKPIAVAFAKLPEDGCAFMPNST
jgi:hypothetical protein